MGGTKSFQKTEKTAAIDLSRGVRFHSAQELYLTQKYFSIDFVNKWILEKKIHLFTKSMENILKCGQFFAQIYRIRPPASRERSIVWVQSYQ